MGKTAVKKQQVEAQEDIVLFGAFRINHYKVSLFNQARITKHWQCLSHVQHGLEDGQAVDYKNLATDWSNVKKDVVKSFQKLSQEIGKEK